VRGAVGVEECTYDAALGLAWLSGSGCHSVLRLLGTRGPESIWAASPAELRRLGMAPVAAVKFDERRRGFVAAEARGILQRAGIRFLPHGSSYYPSELRHLGFPPAGLFVRADEGALERLVAAPRVNIVGTRKATAYGARTTEAFASAFAVDGVTVVSGMALGIDARAHEAALRAGGLTVAILGCGVDVVYPRCHASLYKRLVREAIVMSELPPGTAPSRWTFPHRNRLLAALGDAVLVIEAPRSSGALQTTDWALEIGRPVFSVPGPIQAPSHQGCNQLLYDGAYPALDPSTTVEDYLRLTRMERGMRQGGLRDRSRGVERSTPSGADVALNDDERGILRIIGSAPCSVDDLVAMTGRSARELSVALAELELAGRVARAGPGMYIRAP